MVWAEPGQVISTEQMGQTELLTEGTVVRVEMVETVSEVEREGTAVQE